MTYTIFNSAPLEYGEELIQPTQKELNDVNSFKYAEYNYAYDNCNSNYVRYVLDNIPRFYQHKRILIDIKLHHLNVGQYTCVPGWHLDGSENPNKFKKLPEKFTLFVTGSAALTEFLAIPFIADVHDQLSFSEKSRKIGAQISQKHLTKTIPSCTFTSYGDSDFHRGAVAKHKETRLLVRTTETDIIKPQNKIFTPNYV